MFPHAYVEPYPAFYRQIAVFAEKAETFDVFRNIHGYSTYQSVADYFQDVKKSMAILEEVAQKELNGQPLSEDEESFLGDMLIEGNVSGPEFNGWYVDLLYDSDGGPRYTTDPLESDFLVADVHTQPTDCAGNVVGRVLHVGVGRINLGVFLAESPSNNFQAMAYVGPVMSYYETITDDFDRLTDERWTKLIEEGNLPSRPDWANVYLADVEGKAYIPGRELYGELYSGIQYPGNSPVEFSFVKAYPNPFRNSTKISYTIPAYSGNKFSAENDVDLGIYNLSGQKIKTLVSANQAAGEYHIEWIAGQITDGVYYLRLRAGDTVKVQKIVKIR